MTRPEVRRAAGMVAVGVLVALVCTGLGSWQWVRHEQRAAEITLVEANYGAEPVPLAQVLEPAGDALADDEVWRSVRVSGQYLPDHTVLLRNRPVAGRPSVHVLVPFAVDDADGGVLVVDRGWVPADVSPQEAPPPEGPVEIVVRLRQDEPASRRDAPPRQVQAISVPQVLAAGGLEESTPALGAYGVLVSEDPAPARPLGALPRPSIDPGSNLSYALQWWTFAAGALIASVVLARRELADAAAGRGTGDGAATGGTAGTSGAARLVQAPPSRRRRRGPTAEDVEDALIDAQLR